MVDESFFGELNGLDVEIGEDVVLAEQFVFVPDGHVDVLQEVERSYQADSPAECLSHFQLLLDDLYP